MTDTLLHTLLALLVAIVAARLVGLLFRALNQPPVIGEIVAGIRSLAAVRSWLGRAALAGASRWRWVYS